LLFDRRLDLRLVAAGWQVGSTGGAAEPGAAAAAMATAGTADGVALITAAAGVSSAVQGAAKSKHAQVKTFSRTAAVLLGRWWRWWWQRLLAGWGGGTRSGGGGGIQRVGRQRRVPAALLERRFRERWRRTGGGGWGWRLAGGGSWGGCSSGGALGGGRWRMGSARRRSHWGQLRSAIYRSGGSLLFLPPLSSVLLLRPALLLPRGR
jgi:hypothetical protein